jgi:hypothetical protein
MTTTARGSEDGDQFRTLQEALSVTPSPDFAARVRERIRREPVPSPAPSWAWLAWAATAAAAVIVVAVLWNGRAQPQPGGSPAGTTARDTASGPRPETAAPAARRPTPYPPGVAAPRQAARHGATAPAGRRAAIVPAAAGKTGDVLVPDDERRALDRLLVAIREGRAMAPAPGRVAEDENGLLIESPAIEIPLLRPIELLPGTLLERPGRKEK